MNQSIEMLECHELLDYATPDLYRQNLHKILGLSIGATPSDVRRQQKRLAMQIKLGMAVTEQNSGGFVITAQSTEEESKKALDRLNNPKSRFLDEVFWFWPMNGNGEDPALAALEQGKPEHALHLWNQHARQEGKAAEIAIHNKTILYHLAVLDHELNHGVAEWKIIEKDNLDDHWLQVFEGWWAVCKGDGFWDILKNRVREINDAQLTTGFVNRIRSTIPKALLLINAQIACQAAENGDVELSRRHTNLIQGVSTSQELTNEALREALNPIRNHIKATVDSAKNRWLATPQQGNRHIRELYNQTINPLSAVDILLPKDNLIRIGLHDLIAEAMIEGQAEFSYVTNDWDECKALLEMAQKIAAGESTSNRLREKIEIVQKNKELGNDWCCPEYWNLPVEIITRLEAARGKARAGNYDGAIHDLAVRDPQIGKPLRRSLGYCLSQKGIKVFNDALSEHNSNTPQLETIINKLKKMDERELNIYLINRPTPQTPSYLIPPCPCCGNSYYTSWVNFTYKDIPLFMCSSCNDKDKSYIEQQKKTLREHTTTSLEYILLADEIDPGDSGVQRNLKSIKNTAADIGCSIPSTSSLKNKLGGNKLRGKQEIISQSEADGICYFCGTNKADSSCQIIVPMCSRPKKIMMIFGEGEEYLYGNAIVPRCEKCKDQHKNLPIRIEHWYEARLAVAAEACFPDIVKTIQAAVNALCAAESAETTARDLANFPELAAEEAAFVQEVARQQALLDQINNSLANARNELSSVTGKNIFVKIFKRKIYQQELSQAQAKFEKIKQNFAEAEKCLRPTTESLEATRQKIKIAQDEAWARAQEATRKCSEAVVSAQNKMRIAQERAMKAYEEQTPCPTLPSGINPEEAYLDFNGISVQIKRGWQFGQKPSASGTTSNKPVNVSGLVGRAPRIPSSGPNAGGSFYYQHPDFKAVILPAVSNKDVLCLGTVIHDIDIPNLIADGTIFANYQSLMTSPSALIIGCHVSMLRAWIKEYTDSGNDMMKKWRWLNSYLIDNNEAEARSAMEQMSSQFLDDCHIYFAQFIMHDESLAGRLITQFEAKALNTVSWTKCAKIWKLVFCDEQNARKCLSKADAAAKDSSAWNTCAEGWIGIFQDVDEALRCIAQAEKVAQYTYQWLDCARTWLMLMNDEGEARRCLNKAIECGNSFESCALAWLEMFDDAKEAQRCIEKEETKAEKDTYPGVYTWTGLAKYWQKFGNSKNATRCMRKSETIAEKNNDSLGWHYCVIAWKKVMGNDSEARRCMQKVESCAKSGCDWTWCAKAWAIILPDAINARQCLDKAVSLANSTYDWAGCANIWRDVFSDEMNTRAAAEKATALAEGCWEWRMCAELWLETFGNTSEARRCVVNMEAAAKESYDWRDCASFWDKLGDTVAAARCRRLA